MAISLRCETHVGAIPDVPNGEKPIDRASVAAASADVSLIPPGPFGTDIGVPNAVALMSGARAGAAATSFPDAGKGIDMAKIDYALFSQRCGAMFIDALLVNTVGLVITLATGGLGFLVIVAYYVVCLSRVGGGRTLGCRALGLRLVDQDTGELISLSRAFVWWLVAVIAGVVSWLWFFSDRKKRMLHNIASRSVVING